MTDHDDPRKQEETDDDEPIQMERPADDASPARNDSLGGVDGAPEASGWADPRRNRRLRRDGRSWRRRADRRDGPGAAER